MHRIETQFAGRPLVIETGRLAKQAAGSALVQFGETVVLGAVTVSPNISTLPFFPAHRRISREAIRRGEDPGRVAEARRAPLRRRDPLRAGDRPVDPAALPRGVQERGAGLRHRPLRRPGERRRRARRLGGLGGAGALRDPVERAAGRGAGGQDRGQVGPQSDLPAAGVLGPRHHRERFAPTRSRWSRAGPLEVSRKRSGRGAARWRSTACANWSSCSRN